MNALASASQATSESENAAAAPIYITIGPPACGKSTWLSRHQHEGRSVRDICLDDQRGVFLPIESEHFLGSSSSASNDDRRAIVLEEVRFGRTHRERILQDNAELTLVAKRCAGLLSKEEFKTALATFFRDSSNSFAQSAAVDGFEEVLEELRGEKQQVQLPGTTDLFIREAIFKPDPESGQSALETTNDALFSSPVQDPTAWGNTNTKANDYRVALQMAARQGRPVYFAVYDAFQDTQQATATTISKAGMEIETDLEATGYRGLCKRNLNRYLKTGRYVPVQVIWDMLGRTSSLLQEVVQRAQQQQGQQQTPPCLKRLERDKILVSMAGLEMKDNRTVVEPPPPQNQQHGNNAQRPPYNPQQQRPWRDQQQQPYNPQQQRPWRDQQQPPDSGQGGRSVWGEGSHGDFRSTYGDRESRPWGQQPRQGQDGGGQGGRPFSGQHFQDSRGGGYSGPRDQYRDPRDGGRDGTRIQYQNPRGGGGYNGRPPWEQGRAYGNPHGQGGANHPNHENRRGRGGRFDADHSLETSGRGNHHRPSEYNRNYERQQEGNETKRQRN